ncbi:aminodeoxychorismate/anthranilate synthase component II [Nocardioides sp. NPDC126508]
MTHAAPPRVVVVDDHDSYTWNLVHLIAGVTGTLPAVVQHDATTAAHVLGFDHVVLSPGPGHPADPADFALGGEVLCAGTVPVLGVCLGMQGVVTTYGGRVDRIPPAHGDVARVRHRGDRLFSGVPTSFSAVRYHSLAATSVPPELQVIAETDGDGGEPVVMAVRHRSLPQVGVQFHPESILSEHGAALISNFLSTR